MTQLAVKQHSWVKFVITPVETLPNSEGDPIVLVDPDVQVQAEENAVYGCNSCGEPLAGNYNTECAGESGE